MAKKLKLVDADQVLSPPRPLGEHGLSLWRRVQGEYHVADAGGIELLALACEALERAEACRAQIALDGLTVEGNAGIKEHPLLKHETANRALASRLLVRLGLDVEPVRPVGRPAGGGWRG
jgi:hypothetical protein